MNFSKMKLTRLFALVAVLILMCTLFAGCKQDTAPETTEGALDLDINLETEGQTEPSETEPPVTETEPVVNEKSGTVTAQVNIRTAPSFNGSDEIGTLKAGDKVIVEERYNVTGTDWAYISSPQSGWICMDYVVMDVPDAQSDNTSTPAATGSASDDDDNNASSGNAGSEGTSTSIKGVVTTGLNIRKEPSTTSAVVGAYAKGDVVTIVEKRGEWGRTNKGWIKLQYVNTTGSTTGNGGTGTATGGGNNDVSGNGSTTVILRGVVKVNDLNIRSSASTNGTRLGSYTYGNRVEILEKDGNWGRTEKGWICLDYVYQDGTTGTKTATGTVTGNGLNIRSGPGTGYASVGSLSKGDRVNILEQFTYNGTTWGCIKNGWISLDFVDVDGGNSDSGNDSSTDSDDDGSFGATVTGNGVNVRSGPGTNYGVVGTLNKGDRITIITRQVVNGTEWGKTGDGWVCMDFVTVN